MRRSLILEIGFNTGFLASPYKSKRADTVVIFYYYFIFFRPPSFHFHPFLLQIDYVYCIVRKYAAENKKKK